MTPRDYHGVECGGWTMFFHPDALHGDAARTRALEVAVGAAEGRAIRDVRRSRHGRTVLARLGEGGPEVFIKVLAPARGIQALKGVIRGARTLHVAAISNRLARAGIGVPRVLLYGSERRGGRELVMVERAAGFMVPRWLRDGRGSIESRRAILRELGVQVARLHRAGFIHGDLTPFNVVVDGDREPPRVSFIDHERTRRAGIGGGARARLRNLVQLGRFDLPGVGLTDRMRVWRAYAGAMGLGRARAQRNRLVRMIRARIARDGGMARLRSEPPRHRPVRTAEGS